MSSDVYFGNGYFQGGDWEGEEKLLCKRSRMKANTEENSNFKHDEWGLFLKKKIKKSNFVHF